MNKNKQIKLIPRFKSEDKERKFWATHDVTDYFDMNRPIKLDLSKLKIFLAERVERELRTKLASR